MAASFPGLASARGLPADAPPKRPRHTKGLLPKPQARGGVCKRFPGDEMAECGLNTRAGYFSDPKPRVGCLPKIQAASKNHNERIKEAEINGWQERPKGAGQTGRGRKS